MSLLLITGLCGMFVAERGVPAASLIVVTMTGLALACGGASALNHVLDRDIDKLMGTRTRARPVAAERMPPSRALEFGLTLSAFSFVLLASFVNVLTATLALVGNLFYVLVYTRWLKRSTPQNIVIGGAAGAVPPLVGLAAVTGNLTLPALWLFLIVFLWTPPHFWALALLIRRDYEAARIPMLPVVRGERETTRQILLYAVVLVAVTVVPGRLGAARLRLSRRGACSSAARSSGSRSPCAAKRRHAGQHCSSTSRFSTSRCSSRRWRSTRCCDDRAARADPAPSTTVAPVEPVGEVARKNVVLALALVGVVVLIVLGTIAVSFIYLHYD